ncbi:MAG: ribose 5-phosphate isomerase B [Bacteroidota bacterium]|mgnify:FL=1|nr:ribose 5-phosphate isomerase B [Bacteroidota bacterium]MDX5404617.1 ribose 5-phosphate isomerase B [Bacteroidota bacterium]MDX5427198.1 ribose 5-phosphate isomerase B [Bacteroidota bacterium]MDX5446912.1 ribose 5-phosphate isomerase B [Bacteroidota bacterium]MDX5505160.1 ribose 5-phosphate isomerase B [Bacteroidota bacterium]
MKIAIGADHAGFELKSKVLDFLKERGIEAKDFGAYSLESVDYPDFAHPVAEMVESGDADLGIVICGSGNGINMAVNKHQGIRSALCWQPELAALARQHNNANVLALPARFIDVNTALECVDSFLNSSFEGGRHERRVNKISCS